MLCRAGNHANVIACFDTGHGQEKQVPGRSHIISLCTKIDSHLLVFSSMEIPLTQASVTGTKKFASGLLGIASTSLDCPQNKSLLLEGGLSLYSVVVWRRTLHAFTVNRKEVVVVVFGRVGCGQKEGSEDYPIPVVRPLDKLPFGSLQDLRVSGDWGGQSCEARGRGALFPRCQ